MRKKKWLALLVAVAMVFTMIPAVSFAADNVAAKIGEQEYDTLQEAINDGDGKTIVLQRTVTENIKIPTGVTIVIDLNGATLTHKIDTIEPTPYAIDNAGTLKIINGAINSEAVSTSCVRNDVNGKLTIDNVKITSAFVAVKNENDAELIIDNSEIGTTYTKANTGALMNWGNANVKNSSISGGSNAPAIYATSGADGGKDSAIIIENCELRGKYAVYAKKYNLTDTTTERVQIINGKLLAETGTGISISSSTTLTVEGDVQVGANTVKGVLNNAQNGTKVTLTESVSNKDITIPEGTTLIIPDSVEFTIGPKWALTVNGQLEGNINDANVYNETNKKYYSTLQRAINYADGESRIHLLTDRTEDILVRVATKEIILDLNGKSITGNIATNGTLTIDDTSTEPGLVNGTLSVGENSGTLIIIAGKYTDENVEDFIPEGTVKIQDDDGNFIIHTHSISKVDVKLPTYTEVGNIAYWYCSSCEKYFKNAELTEEITQADTVIPKKIWISADYTAVEAAIAKANALTASNYKDFSAVEAAIKAVVRDKNSSAQAEVDAMAKAIEDAIGALQYKDADYTAVDAALEKAAALNKEDYKDFSAVEAAIAAVVRDKNITQQAEVDAMAKAIEDAIAALEAVPKPEPEPAETVTKADIAAGSMALNKKIKATWTNSNLAVTWGKVSKADGYEVYAAKCGNSYIKIKTVKGNGTLKYTIKKIKGKKLDPKKSYKVCVKAYHLIDGKKKYTGTSYGIHTVGPKNKTYTNAKSVKASKKSITLKKGKTQKASVKITKQTSKKKLLKSSHVANLRYFSTNTKVATVTKSGSIKAAGKGTCTVYALAANGVKTTVKVTVK